MQQISLFKEPKYEKINKWNIFCKTMKINKDENKYYITNLKIPSWSFLTKYTLNDGKIETFEIIDYTWYLHMSVSMIKNLKSLIWTIIKNQYIK